MQIVDARSFAVRALGTVLALAVLAGAFACGYFLGLRNATGIVHGDGGGTGRTAEQLDQAAGAQQRITTDLRGATESAGRLSDRIDAGARAVDRGRNAVQEAAGSADSIDKKIDESRRLIDECQRILQEIRSRSEADQGAN